MKPAGVARSVAALLATTVLADSVRPDAAQTAAKPLFREVAAETGLRFHHFSGSSGEYYIPEILGAGGALLDYDVDGDLDVLLLQGSMLEAGRTPELSRFPPEAGQPLGHRLFRNDLTPGGALRFTDVTEASGLSGPAYGMGAAVGDYDDDGDPDLYLTGFGASVLYRNDGGRFRDVTAASGAATEGWSTSASFVDYDRDGDLDLFVARYIDFTVAGNKKCFDAVGARDYCLPAVYRSVPDRLYRNEGGGRFSDATVGAGVGDPSSSTAALFFDYDRDGWLDLFVGNNVAFDAFWDELVRMHRGVLEIALGRTLLHRRQRAHAAVGLVRPALEELDLPGRFLGAGEKAPQHHRVGARGDRLGDVAGEAHAAIGDERDAALLQR